MRATVMFGAGDVRIENVPDARLIEPTDALVAVTRACICGSDLWPYRTLGHSDIGRRMGHEAIVVVEAVGGRSEGRPLLHEVHAAQNDDTSARVSEPPTIVTEGHDPAVRDGREPGQQWQATGAEEGNDDGDDEAAHPSHDIGDPVAAP